MKLLIMMIFKNFTGIKKVLKGGTMAAEKKEYKISFRMKFPGKEVSHQQMWIDLFILDLIIKPIVQYFSSIGEFNQIAYWRVHRRSADDEAKHMFSFLCEMTEATLDKVVTMILCNDYYIELKKSGYMIALVKRVENLRLSSEWCNTMVTAWPIFANGMSQTLMVMIDYLKTVEEPELNSFKDREEYYKSMHEKISSVWRVDGGHAFLHHLNAFFGYQGVEVKPEVHRQLLTF